MFLFIEPILDPDMNTRFSVETDCGDHVITFDTYAEAEAYCDKEDPVD